VADGEYPTVHVDAERRSCDGILLRAEDPEDFSSLTRRDGGAELRLDVSQRNFFLATFRSGNAGRNFGEIDRHDFVVIKIGRVLKSGKGGLFYFMGLLYWSRLLLCGVYTVVKIALS